MATVRRETSWRRRWKPNLNSQPWRPFFISGEQFLVKSMFVEMDCSYEFCLWDFSTLWYEKVEHDNFRARAKELNPNVEAKLSYLLKFVQKSVEECNQKGEATFTVNEDVTSDDELIVKMKTKLQAGVPFVWEFNCSVGQNNMVGSQLVQPMSAMIAELHRRQAELFTLLRRKDQEIMDYKDSGARLSRKSLGTREFDEDTFKSKMILSQGFEDAVKEAATRGFDDASCDLYKQVMIKTAWLAEKDLPEPEEEEEDDADDIYASLAVGGAVGGPSAPSWTDVPPPSLLGKDGEPSTTSPRVSPRKTPVTSPTKSSAKSSPANSPSKDMELQRREELQRRLNEEAERKKRKKRKINL